ncbi:hypothetical protein [Runella aurantiaca]|uniref:Uncharacterized protein n=1 Tax=Runella aurantiaca TaxID=2282308 RepID=A0A369IDE0_9BACT|nr:hypothetical protein [Runella aurantiaca]RDB07801.1 hypothetical protein DVG78_01730 [Runella aurantiaca]
MVKSLLTELLIRISALRNSIAASNLHKSVSISFRNLTEQRLIDLKIKIEKSLNRYNLDIPDSANNFYSDYQRFSEELKSIEHYRIQALKRYGKAENYFYFLVKSLIQEFRLQCSAPMVTSISSARDYFWITPDTDLIGVPLGEEGHLINLPDLVHELSHVIVCYFDSDYPLITRDFKTIVGDFFQREIYDAEDKRRPLKIQTLLPICRKNWQRGWLVEFTCDLIATYLVGPAYAWTNLKVSASDRPKDIYYIDSETHPSHEARSRAIIAMLKKMDLVQEANQIQKEWESILSFPNYEEPEHYRLIFPQVLIDKLTDIVFQSCKEFDFRSYKDQLQSFDLSISAIMNQSWNQLMENPGSYAAWEADIVEILNKRVTSD